MPIDIDLNVAFTFTDEQSSSKCQTTAPEFEFEQNHPSHLIVEDNMNQDVPSNIEVPEFEFKLTHFPYLNVEGNMNKKISLQEKISNNDSFSIENGE